MVLDLAPATILTEKQIFGIGNLVARAIEGMETNGNPWNLARVDRATWADGLGLRTFAEAPSTEVLFWVGCAASYDDRSKKIAFWVAEKAGRLKLNGQLTGYSPLSRMVEVEGLIAGVNGKRSLWLSLLDVAEAEPKLDADRLRRLVERADQQLATLQDLRERAAREAFLD